MVEYLINHLLDLAHNLNLRPGDRTKIEIAVNEDNFVWKTTSKYGRRPQNTNGRISQQPLVGSCSYFTLKTRGPTQNWKLL